MNDGSVGTNSLTQVGTRSFVRQQLPLEQLSQPTYHASSNYHDAD